MAITLGSPADPGVCVRLPPRHHAHHDADRRVGAGMMSIVNQEQARATRCRLPGAVTGEVGRGEAMAEPTHLQWSPGPMSGERGGTSNCGMRTGSTFNGAPDRCPGRGGFKGIGSCDGPGAFNGAPDRCPGRESRPCRSRACPPPFNGAPDRCPGRVMVKTVPILLGWHLQWSPGPMSGESCSGNGRATPRVRTFNGAPDRCPGRGRSVSGARGPA